MLITKEKILLTRLLSLNYKSELLNPQRLSLALQNTAPYPQKGQNTSRSRCTFPSINWHGKRPVNTMPWAPPPTTALNLFVLHWKSWFNLYTC